MTALEYSYTETDIYRAIVQTAVPIALTAEEVDLLVADLIALAAEMPHDTPASVFAEKCYLIDTQKAEDTPDAWTRHLRQLVCTARRRASLDRITRQYPSLKGTV